MSAGVPSSLAFVTPKEAQLILTTCVSVPLGANSPHHHPPNHSSVLHLCQTNHCPRSLPTNRRPFLFRPGWFYFRQAAHWVLLPGQPSEQIPMVGRGNTDDAVKQIPTVGRRNTDKGTDVGRSKSTFLSSYQGCLTILSLVIKMPPKCCLWHCLWTGCKPTRQS